MTSRVLLGFALVVFTACGGGATTPALHPVASAAPSSAQPPSGNVPAGAVERLRTSLAAGDPARLAECGLVLARAGGAREMTGEAADDERVAQATVLARHEGSVAVLVLTSCGNAALATWRWGHERWTPVTHRSLVSDMHPGRCAITTVHGEALALSDDAHREVALVLVSQDATGDTVHGPVLSVVQLDGDGALTPLLEDAPYGAMDDTTGATTTGAYLVVEDIPAPRDLNVTIGPGRPGPGGPPAAQVTRRRYGLRHGRLELVDESSESAQ